MTIDNGTLKIHPAANLFPMMDKESFQALKEDIRKNGLREWLTLWKDGSLLDGRNRYRACTELGIEPTCSQFEDDSDTDPYAYALSANLHRRHLTTSQKAMIAGRIANLKRESNLKQNAGSDTETQNCTSVDSAACLLSVSPRSVNTAKKILNEGSDAVVEAVDAGNITVSLAAKLVNEVDDKGEQTRLVKQGAKVVREYVTPQSDFVEQAPIPAAEVEEPLAQETETFACHELVDETKPWVGKLVRQFDKIAKANGGQGEYHKRALEAMNTVIHSLKQMRKGER